MSIRLQIQQALDQVEAEASVKIIFAVESGSRAWGFPSQDSDYDVRFIYIFLWPEAISSAAIAIQKSG